MPHDLPTSAHVYTAVMKTFAFVTFMSMFIAIGCGEPEQKVNLERDCKAGDATACLALGGYYTRYHPHEPSASVGAFEKACDGGAKEGCHRAGVFWKTDHYRVPADPRKAIAFLKKACTAGIADACGEMAAIYQVGQGTIRKNRGLALDLYQQACDGESGNACHALAMMYRSIHGVKPDHKKVAALYSRACNLNVARSCLHLAEHYFVGWGVPRDAVQGRKLLELACARGDGLACSAVKAPLATGGGTATDTSRAWRKMVTTPSPFAVLNGAQTNRDYLKRLGRIREAYQGIDTANADPELTQYVDDWLGWTEDATRFFDEQQRRREMAGALLFPIIVGRMATERNERGEVDSSSLQRGARQGIRESEVLTRNPNEHREATALVDRARKLENYQDPLSLRLEMAHGIYLPPPASRPEE